MEDIIFQIYGTFILTLAGFVLPILTVALSAFPEGIALLKQKYINEQKQAEKNLEIEFNKKTEESMDYNVLSKTISKLKKDKRKAESRMSYLSPGFILIKSSLALGISLISFLCGLYFFNSQIFFIPYILFLISLGGLVWFLIIFSNSTSIIIEASIAVQSIRKGSEEKIIELLSILVDNSKQGDKSLFIDHTKISVSFDDKKITDGYEYIYSANKKHPIKITLSNSSEYMLKTAELGFIFPEEFLIEGKTISSTYIGDTQKIIRFKHEYIQANQKQLEGSIHLTSLKTGIFDVDVFVKGENLKNKNTKFKIKIID